MKTEQALYFRRNFSRARPPISATINRNGRKGRAGTGLRFCVENWQVERAKQLISDAWRNMSLSAAQEKEILNRFPGLITHADSKYRMDRYLYAEDTKSALRIAQSLSGDDLLIAQARIAVINKASNAKQLLDAAATRQERCRLSLQQINTAAAR